ncbi:EpsG family protein [Hoylesella oralis]|uniref:EpsG family protein n=1 Tax=Hoylesella oralis TaxID=28134 RepID=UPI0036D3C3EB
MYLYILIFIFVLSVYSFTLKKGGISNKQLAWLLGGLAVFVGIADMLGGFDRYVYGMLFDDLADGIRNKDSILDSWILQTYPKELGYVGLNYLIATFTANRYIFIFITTLIIYALFYKSIKDYTDNYPFALLLFLGLLFFFSFTYLRQILGVGVAWLSIKYVYERKVWKFLLVMFIAFLMHNSALILVPVYWIPIRKFDKATVLIGLAVCFVLGITGLPSSLFEIYGSASDMEMRASRYTDTSGFRIAYLIEAIFFLFFILTNYHKIPENPKRIVLLNVALLFCAILLVFIKSENGGRLGWYYMIGIISTLTYFAVTKKRDKSYRFSMIAVSALLFLRILLQWNSMLYPYKTFFTNGHREGDRIYEMDEYDEQYDLDKFYR